MMEQPDANLVVQKLALRVAELELQVAMYEAMLAQNGEVEDAERVSGEDTEDG